MKIKFVIWFVVVYVVLFCLDILLILNKVSLDSANVWNWGWMIAALQMVYLTLSFRIVGPKDLAAMLFFGRPLYEAKSGLHLVPFVICQLYKETALTVQIQIPGEPEQIDRSGTDTPAGVEAGKVLPIRAPSGSHEIAKQKWLVDYALVENDPLNKRMTLEVTAQIRLKINDIVVFIRTIGSMKEAEKQIRDTAEAVIKGEFVTRTPALILAHWKNINSVLQNEINNLVGNWGVSLETGTQLIDVDLGRTVNLGLRDALNAGVVKAKTITDAEAARRAEEEKGAGIAKARKLLLLAEASGLKKLAELAKLPEGQVAMVVQQAKEMYQNANYSVLPGNGEGLFGAVAGIQEILKRIQSNTPESAGTTSTTRV